VNRNTFRWPFVIPHRHRYSARGVDELKFRLLVTVSLLSVNSSELSDDSATAE